MTAVGVTCGCRRCSGATYLDFAAYLDAHPDAEDHEDGIISSRARHPSARDPREVVRVATFPDGSQVLVEKFPGTPATAASRPDRWATWSPPVELEEAP